MLLSRVMAVIAAGVTASCVAPRVTLGGEVRAVGVNVQLQLINMKCYRERIRPAYAAWAERRDTEPVRDLLKEAAEQAPEAASIYDLNDYKRHERYLKKSEELAPAIGRGEKGAVAELLDLMGELTAQQWQPGLLTRREAVDALAKIENPGNNGNVERVIRRLFPALVDLICVPWNQETAPVQDMGTGPLVVHLLGASQPLRLLFEGMASGEELPVSTGASTTLLDDTEVELLSKELDRRREPPAGGRLRREIEHLRVMVELTRQNPELRLGLTVL